MNGAPVRGTVDVAHRLASSGTNLAVGTLVGPMVSWLSRHERFRSLPARLLVSDPPAPADLIHVLGGGSGQWNVRVDHGIDLFHRGFAPRMLLTGSEWGIDWPHRNRARALERGVPAAAMWVDPGPRTTRGEARALGRLLAEGSIRSVILVTEAFHAGRAARIFARVLSGSDLALRSCPAACAGYPPPRWWEDRPPRGRVLGEALRLALARAIGGA